MFLFHAEPTREGSFRSEYCVAPDGTTDLSHLLCSPVTFAQLLANSTFYFKSFTTVTFMPGQYHISQGIIFNISNIQEFVISGIGMSDDNSMNSEIVCQSSERSGFLFANIKNLTIKALTFSNCGVAMVYGPGLLVAQSKQKMATLFVANVTNLVFDRVVVQNGYGYGIYGINIIGHSSISNSLLTNNTLGGNAYLQFVDLDHSAKCLKMHRLMIQNSSFTYGKSILRLTSPVSVTGSGLAIRLEQTTYAVNITLSRLNAIGNIARKSPNIQVESSSNVQNVVVLRHSTASHGTELFAGASGFHYSYTHFYPSVLQACENSFIPMSALIQLTDNYFINNVGGEDPSLLNEITSQALGMTFFIASSKNTPHDISITDCSVHGNVGGNGVGFYAQLVSFSSSEDNIKIEITNCSFVNNTSTSLTRNRLSVLLIINIRNLTMTNITVANNTGTGLLLDQSKTIFEGQNTFQNNSAYNGGGLALHGDSFVYFASSFPSLHLIGNSAENAGGGIYIAKSLDSTIPTQCFFQFYKSHIQWHKSSQHDYFVFRNNSAGLAGDDLYGGSFEMCLTNVADIGWKVFPYVSGYLSRGYLPEVSARPTRVCLCDAETNIVECTRFVHSISAHPGSSFSISAVAMGQLFCVSNSNTGGAPSAVYASLIPNANNRPQGSIPDSMITQEAGRRCSRLTYQVNSVNANEVIVLTVERKQEKSQNSHKVISKAEFWCEVEHEALEIMIHLPVYINVSLLPCPLGFELSPQGVCDCASKLKEQQVVCSIDTETIHRKPPMWIGTNLELGSVNHTIYIVHRNCPFDYCLPHDIHNMSLNDTDKQCGFNRSGILCGTCKDNLSNVLGSSKCRKCSNLYLFLLIPFAIAGVMLVTLLIVTNLTVTVGTINGLLFYANIIRQYESSFFPSHTDANVLTVFIAWLNLDLGITSCLYDGMDTYVRTWLEFVFPLYIWLLALAIIVSCHYLSFMAKVCGKNIVQVLATLFLLSHIKLQRSIITGLSFTTITLSNNQSLAVWLSDPSLNYLQGSHVYLFVACIGVFLVLFFPYTLTILFGHCLLARSNHKFLTCVQKLKPVFDAYLGPYKDRHRHWIGVLLFARILLVVLSAVNLTGDPSVNLLVTAVISYMLTILVWQSGGVYKVWVLTALESFFILNVGLLSTVTLYIRVHGGNQLLAAHLSCGISFIAFLAVLMYHILVYTPINITERKWWNCSKKLVSGLSVWKSLVLLLASSPEKAVYDHLEPGERELTDIASFVETNPDTESRNRIYMDWECDSESPTENREVPSMLISFNAAGSPIFECGTVHR